MPAPASAPPAKSAASSTKKSKASKGTSKSGKSSNASSGSASASASASNSRKDSGGRPQPGTPEKSSKASGDVSSPGPTITVKCFSCDKTYTGSRQGIAGALARHERKCFRTESGLSAEQERLRDHQRNGYASPLSSGETILQCDLCGKVFRGLRHGIATALARHRRNCQSGEAAAAAPPGAASKEEMQCVKCGKRFVGQSKATVSEVLAKHVPDCTGVQVPTVARSLLLSQPTARPTEGGAAAGRATAATAVAAATAATTTTASATAATTAGEGGSGAAAPAAASVGGSVPAHTTGPTKAAGGGTCTSCGFSGDSKARLDAHQCNTEANVRVCDVCGFRAENRFAFAAHFRGPRHAASVKGGVHLPHGASGATGARRGAASAPLGTKAAWLMGQFDDVIDPADVVDPSRPDVTMLPPWLELSDDDDVTARIQDDDEVYAGPTTMRVVQNLRILGRVIDVIMTAKYRGLPVAYETGSAAELSELSDCLRDLTVRLPAYVIGEPVFGSKNERDREIGALLQFERELGIDPVNLGDVDSVDASLDGSAEISLVVSADSLLSPKKDRDCVTPGLATGSMSRSASYSSVMNAGVVGPSDVAHRTSVTISHDTFRRSASASELQMAR